MATSYLKNTLSHGVSVGSGRKPSGSVWAVDGEEGKKWENVPGIEKASKTDHDDYLASRAPGVTSDQSGEMLTRKQIAAQRVEHRLLTVAGPLQRVVGDDEAPLGPPTGETSTKKAEAEKDLAHALAFGPNEAKATVPEPEVKETFSTRANSQLVHNEQKEARDVANEVAEGLNEQDREAAKAPRYHGEEE